MTSNSDKPLTSKKLCQQIWAVHKYEVLSQSQAIYKTIRQYLKEPQPESQVVIAYIKEARHLPEHRGSVGNAFQHVWGYFKKQASQIEKEAVLFQMAQYHHGQTSKETVVQTLKVLLAKYPNTYLQNSTFLGEPDHEALA